MKVSHNVFKKSNIDRNKKVYQCSSCNDVFNWNDEASCYGNYKDLENNPSRIKYFFSKECQSLHNPITNKIEK